MLGISNIMTLGYAHFCRKCTYECNCAALSTKFCIGCKVCKHTEDLVAEAKVYQIINEPLTEEEAFEEMGGDEEQKAGGQPFIYDECRGIRHSECPKELTVAGCKLPKCDCVCHKPTQVEVHTYYRSEFCMGLGHSQCGDVACTCVCHDSSIPIGL